MKLFVFRGEILTTIHPNASWSTKERQEDLMFLKGLRCGCRRCVDATELGLHTGTLKCSECPGWVLPVDTATIESCAWQCDQCGRQSEGQSVKQLLAEFWKSLKLDDGGNGPKYVSKYSKRVSFHRFLSS